MLFFIPRRFICHFALEFRFVYAYMFQRNYAASTANTYISALGYSHRLAGVHDPTKVFWVIEMLKGYGKLGSRLDTRMPKTLPILRPILQQTLTICGSDYCRYLFTAMCTTAFFGFLRVGEITCCPRSSDVLQLDQVVRLLELTFKLTFIKSLIIHEENTKEITTVAEVLNRQEICVDLHKL